MSLAVQIKKLGNENAFLNPIMYVSCSFLLQDFENFHILLYTYIVKASYKISLSLLPVYGNYSLKTRF